MESQESAHLYSNQWLHQLISLRSIRLNRKASGENTWMELENLEDPRSYDKQHQILPFRHDCERLNATHNLDLCDLELHILCGIEQPAVLASVLWFKARDISERKMPASAVFTIASVRPTRTLWFFFFFQQRQLILTRTCHILPIQLDLFVHFVFWTALDRRDLSAISARISPDDIRLFAICRLLSFAFLLYHSSLQGMKMSNKWHHCHVWISFSLPGPLIW